MTRLAILDKFDNYCKAIDEIRDKQLRVLHEQHFQQSENKLDEIEIWNNVFALVYIKHKYGMIKEVLELLSDSRNHIWLKYGKEKRENHYKSITDTILTDLDERALTTTSLDDLWDKITKKDFQKQLRQIRWNLYFEAAAFFLSKLIAVLILIGLMLTGMAFGALTSSVTLYLCSLFVPLGIILICSLINIQFFPQLSDPYVFKHEIAQEFLALEKNFKKEIESSHDFLEYLTFQISLSKTNANVSEQILTVRPPSNFESKKSRADLNRIFKNNKLITFAHQDQEQNSMMIEVETAYGITFA